MLRSLLIVSCFVFAVAATYPATCDCNHYPYQPESCAHICREAIVGRASKSDLVNKIKLKDDVAAAIIKDRDEHSQSDISELKARLSAPQYKDLTDKLNELSGEETASLATKYGIGTIKAGSYDAALPNKRNNEAPGGGPGMVWVNTSTNVYYCPGARHYGKTKEGKYMTESQARAAEAYPDHGKGCGQ